MKRKILVVGDHKTGSGPANVTKKYIDCMGKEAFCLRASSKMLRALELILKIPFAAVVFCSGYSAQNVLAAKWAHFLKKKCVYLDHGSVEHEDKINFCTNEAMNRVEYETLALCDRIYAVSAHFAKWLQGRYPEFADKIEFQTNGVDRFEVRDHSSENRNLRQIFSVGGGMPRKRINRICEAIEILRREEAFRELKLVVTGQPGAFSDAINAFPFVQNLGVVPRGEIERLFAESGLFIQNSCFETFGLAPMEALSYGCDILLSKEIGALELFDIDGAGIAPYIIEDCEDPKEIAEKIRGALGSKNAARFCGAFDREASTWEKRTEELMTKLRSL